MKSQLARKQQCCNTLKSVDMFGEQVNFTFKSEKTYNTTFGGAISLFCLLVLGSFFVTRTQKFLTQDDPFFSMTKQTLEGEPVITNLLSLGLYFFVEEVPANIGQVVANHVSWRAGEDKVVTPVPLIDCAEIPEIKNVSEE